MVFTACTVFYGRFLWSLIYGDGMAIWDRCRGGADPAFGLLPFERVMSFFPLCDISTEGPFHLTVFLLASSLRPHAYIGLLSPTFSYQASALFGVDLAHGARRGLVVWLGRYQRLCQYHTISYKWFRYWRRGCKRWVCDATGAARMANVGM
jgi:predicted small integral membrane protein